MTMRWTAAFRSAPVSPYESMTLIHPSRGFGNETLRQVVRVRGGGDRLRVRFSNLYGKQPLTIASTRVAALESGSSIIATTDTAITFDGTPHVTIGVGAEAVSDPVDFATTAETDLVVSTYYASETGPATYHPFALQTGYVARGDVVSHPELSDPEEVESRFHLSGLDVWTRARRHVVAVFGDSLADGVGTTPGADLRYPDLLARRVSEPGMSVINLGIAGNRLLTDVFGERGITRFDREVLATPGVTHAIVQLGVNDIGMPGMFGLPAVPVADLIAGLTSIAERAKRHGLTTIIATVTPFGGAAGVTPGFDTPESEETRQRLNQWIRANQEFDAVADLDRVLHDPAVPAALLPRYDSGDHIHPSDAGAEVIADVLFRALIS
ncbi:SGNH/GDSL hydrolase family protein [Streptosporangium subroseum]|uniref:SGNH/GDSL hydrolase family protein n=1 Tax=Streptosporangium subroseum TaxID=106412 RepID=UPI00308B4E06|nr:SGNH/GDSL hydrolase family protein [Streptosporangium subroseum]